mgnify:CR=1 FL=1
MLITQAQKSPHNGGLLMLLVASASSMRRDRLQDPSRHDSLNTTRLAMVRDKPRHALGF